MPNISIIIPVYNAQNYLERCLDSVVNQTLKDIEIICVNDCSTDNSLDILKNYATRYSNLKIIDCKENGGESKARNIGLDNATGEYLAFVDNDDEIDLDFCQKLYNKAVENNADIVKGEVEEISYSGKKIQGGLNKTIRANNDKLFFTYHWWTAIYKKTLIDTNNIRFLENYSLGGDILFLNQAILSCKNLQLVDDSIYHYYRREDSGDSKELSVEKVSSALDIYEKCIDNLNASSDINYESLGYQTVCYWFIRSCINLGFRNKSLPYKEICATILPKLYYKCQNRTVYIDKEITKDFSIEMLNNIKQKNIPALIKLLSNYSSVMRLMLASIRERTKNEIK